MFPKSETEIKLDAQIQVALNKLNDLEPTSEEYGVVVEHISELHKLKTESRFKLKISPDTALIVAANIFGVLWIARYERDHVINGKGFGHIIKPR